MTHRIGPFAPAAKVSWIQQLPHSSDDLTLGQACSLPDFFKGDSVGPGGPDQPKVGSLGRLGFLDSRKRSVTFTSHALLPVCSRPLVIFWKLDQVNVLVKALFRAGLEPKMIQKSPFSASSLA